MGGYIRSFHEIGLADVGLVGGKTASLGELYSALSSQGIAVPNGFAITADAYREALSRDNVAGELHQLLDRIDKSNIKQLASRATKARAIIYDAMDTAALRNQVMEAYRQLEREAGAGVAVAVRSSATAEDLPTASFAGQHESFLNVRGPKDLFDACRRCFASIFTDRAISYRIDSGFDHFKVALSVAVMKMVRSDLAASGVVFTLDTESGFRDVVFVTACYGLGETIVQGQVDPDEFYVHKPTLGQGYRHVLRRRLGAKQIRMIYGKRGGDHATLTRKVPEAERRKFCISDQEVLKLAEIAVQIEAHYSEHAGAAMPMDIEWAKDGSDGTLYIIQARPETVASRRSADVYETHNLKEHGPVIVNGRAVGEKIASGRARRVVSSHDLAAFKPGEILVAPATSPDWEPVMKIAAGIITDKGGRTCHAAIIARELGIPAVVGTGLATQKIKTGTEVTICCAEGDVGSVYQGKAGFDVTRTPVSQLRQPRTAIMVNVGTPEMAFRTAMQPQAGVGLARMEFIISEHIRIHPMALLKPDKVKSAKARAEIAHLVRGFESPADFFVQRLAEGVGTIAAAFYPKPVIVRLSDFKTNEYASLIGGEGFEPSEENPMLGFRGASRYSHPAYTEGFALECAALRLVRQEMGLSNLRVMVPFCRTIAEGRRVIATMAANGLKRGEDGLEIYVMCEIPNNVIQIDAFAELFDGFSIGSNDLTQLTLGVDRDSDIVAFDFDERDPGMLEMFRQAIAGAKRNGRHIGICGEAPANDPEIARYLTGLGIDSISVNPSSVFRTMAVVADAETNPPRPKA
ncbi:phosphoenolpyruvate synthase [Bradyrhizobium sp. GCM10027634]|uniref:phosphoenolpyruvate synthase n=1 Tax=unclassified Bradyrhizobium TaxID=2631580 RepID=UPI00188D155C|nr:MULTISPECIES: phosphoenolpyruvate synthase [unclassified Bradyrhizobium]MDN5001318.1 phosphoenolpyruvate synthase [Bradyrhizobium sp. WYCCWR 12677]QOZ46319.1 phosphoenolpyruvate synthase [Bradyrhizobium sp. CCBAU 53340]